MTTAVPVASRLERGPDHRANRWLPIALGAQPLLLAANAFYHPEVDIEGASFLEAVREGPTEWFVVHLVAALGAVLWIPAAFAMRRLAGDASRRLSTLALASVVAGATMLAAGFIIEGSVFRLIAEADIGDAAALTLADDFLDTAEFIAILPGFGLSLAGVALITAILVRQRRSAGWHALAYLVGFVVSAVSPPGSPVGPLALVVATVAAIGMARQGWPGTREDPAAVARRSAAVGGDGEGVADLTHPEAAQ